MWITILGILFFSTGVNLVPQLFAPRVEKDKDGFAQRFPPLRLVVEDVVDRVACCANRP